MGGWVGEGGGDAHAPAVDAFGRDDDEGGRGRLDGHDSLLQQRAPLPCRAVRGVGTYVLAMSKNYHLQVHTYILAMSTNDHHHQRSIHSPNIHPPATTHDPSIPRPPAHPPR